MSIFNDLKRCKIPIDNIRAEVYNDFVIDSHKEIREY
jgi:hypothetical protein